MATTFQDFVSRVYEQYEAQNYSAAGAIIDSEKEQFPEQQANILFWKTCFLAIAGQTDEALRTLAESIEGYNHWYYEAWLRRDTDLEALQGHPEFERLVALSNQRIEELMNPSRLRRLDVAPTQAEKDSPSPLLIALHGNNSSAELSKEFWESASQQGWFVSLPMSTQPASDTLARWDDEAWTARDVAHHFNELIPAHQIDSERIVIGGFSMGARQALSLGLNQVIPVKGIIALGAALGDGLDRWQAYIEKAQDHKPRVCLLVGDADDLKYIYEPTQGLADRLQAHGIPCQLKVFAGLEHDFPADFAETLQAALAWITD